MLRLARPLGVAARRQFVSRPLATQIRGYAERSGPTLSSDASYKPNTPNVPVVPKVPVTPPVATSATPASTTSIPPENVPKIPPSPDSTSTASKTGAPSSISVAEASAVPPPSPGIASASGKTATPASISVPPPSPSLTSTSGKTATPASISVAEASTVPPPSAPPPTSTTAPSTIATTPPPSTTASTPPIAPATPSSPPPPPPPSSPPRTPRRWRRLRLLFYLTLISALGYGGAVWFALRNDNFHDFFTEYVPFGEDAVRYFEERAFVRRFPNARANVYKSPLASKDGEQKRVKIPSQSGLSWKTVDEKKGSDVSQHGKHMSAVDDAKAVKQDTLESPSGSTVKEKSATVSSAKKDASSTAAPAKAETKPKAESKKETKAEAAAAQPSPAIPSPKSDPRPPVLPPVTAISNVNVPNANEPVVQDLVKILNDLITVVNADGADTANRYSAPMEKAKESLTAVASKISTLRDAEHAAAEERIKEMHKEFDEGARKLLERIETSQREDDAKYREEFEAERAKIAEQYEQRLKAEVERTEQVLEQRHKNEISEQGIKMQKKFIDDVKGLVEAERNGRLSKLTDLSSNVDNLTQLASNWNGIIDANLATQKLQVAVDAVRSVLDDSNATHKPTPFVREMAALKLVADSDPIVDAAVASINPAAYQKGIPSSAQLIDRFRRVASEVRKASLLPENAGVASHAASFVLSKVMFQKKGVPEGNDVESILTRTETLLEEGDLDNAAREMNDLKGWAGVLSRDWMTDVRKVLEVKQALDVIETEARLQCLRVE